MTRDGPSRHIRSYVLRQGRLTAGQAKALENCWPRFGIEYAAAKLDLPGLFGRHAPRVLDIGSGKGASTAALAAAHPENDYLAVEVHRPGVGSLLRLADQRGLGNIRIICHDVVDVLEHLLPDASIDQVYIFFPDPWPKKRHHKRRLISAGFLDLLTPKLKANGRLFIATDWEDMAKHVLGVCDGHHRLVNLAGTGNPAPRPVWRPPTRFEQRGRELSHGVHDFAYCLSIP